ncbi:MAG: SoxR reducing system RseC family protein [Gammaproteobacteria bacterium]|nr:SoxR reducing system RseC family protein [Gammaproteobacteria bacterium]NVK88099.1 SoxR reducing system RseC family protein [Gammaproteobacteria bacterium]
MTMMQKELAQVVIADREHVWLAPTARSGCSSCQVNSTCGTGILQQWLGRNRMHLKLPNTLQLETGDQVMIGIPQQAVLIAGLWTYCVPLLALLIAAVVADSSGLAEGLVIVAAFAGLLVGWLAARLYAATRAGRASLAIKLLGKVEPNIKLQMP